MVFSQTMAPIFTFKLLKKVHEGTLDPSNKRDVKAAAPLIVQCLKHNNPDLIEALLQENLRQAGTENSSSCAREKYWQLLNEIQKNKPVNADKITGWLIKHYGHPAYTFFSEDEELKRNKEIENYDDHLTGNYPLALLEKSVIEQNLRALLQESILRLDEENSVSAAIAIQHFLENDSQKNPFLIRPNHPVRGELLARITEHDNTGYLEKIYELLEKLDLINENKKNSDTKRNSNNLTKLLILPALASDTPLYLRNFILEKAEQLPSEEKLNFFTSYKYQYMESPATSLCETHRTKDRHIFFTPDIQQYDDWMDLLLKWNKDSDNKILDAAVKFILDKFDLYVGSGQSTYSIPAIRNDFHPALKWEEIENRLKFLPSHAPFPIDEVSFSNIDYLKVAIQRAAHFGHADDLKAALAYALTLSDEEKDKFLHEYGFSRGLPNDVVSRDADTLKVYIEYLTKEEFKFWDGYAERALIALMPFLDPQSGGESFFQKQCSYFSNGIAMSAKDLAQGSKVIIEAFKIAWPNMSDINRATLRKSFLKNYHEQSFSFGENARVLLNSENPEIAKAWIEIFYTIFPRLEEDFPQNERQSTQSLEKFFSHLGNQTLGFEEIAKFKIWVEALQDVCREDYEKLSEKHGSDLQGLYFRHVYDEEIEVAPSPLTQELTPLVRIAAEIEGNTGAIFSTSLRLGSLFTSFGKANKFISNHIKPGRQPLHDLCLFDIPKDPNWTKEIWENLAIRYGYGITKHLGLAPAIEAHANNNNLDLRTMKPEAIRNIASLIRYPRGEENIEIAHFCHALSVSEEHFNETLELVKTFNEAANKGEIKSNMPSIDIDGKDLGLEGYSLSRIPQGNVLNLWIGKIVNCCNHLGYVGRDMAIAQFMKPDNALYCLSNKDDQITAKLSGWLSKKGNLVFNAWERIHQEEDFLMSRFVLAAAIQTIEKNKDISRVMLGAGPIQKSTIPFDLVEKIEPRRDNVSATGDSMRQFQIASRDTLEDDKAKLEKLIKEAGKRGEVRVKLTTAERQALKVA